MADLSTLDATKPADSDPVSAGASRMREERSALLTSFGLEHGLAGVHKFLQSNFAGLPAAGNAGRIALDTTAGKEQLYLDDGSAWGTLHPIWVQSKSVPGNMALTASVYTEVLGDTLVLSATSNVIYLMSVVFIKAVNSCPIAIRFEVDGIDVMPFNKQAANYSVAALPDSFIFTCWGFSPSLAGGSHTISFKVHPGVTGLTKYSTDYLAIVF